MGRIYYGPFIRTSTALLFSDLDQLVRQRDVYEELVRDQFDLQSSIKDLSSTLVQRQQQIDSLDALIDKWTDAMYLVLEDLRGCVNVPIQLKDLVIGAGFKEDSFDFDYSQIDNNQSDNITFDL